MEEPGPEGFSVLDSPDICHDAMKCGLECLNSSTAVPQGDHLKERTRLFEFKVYWPQQLKEIRAARGITDRELIHELSEELYVPSKMDKIQKCLHSERKRFLVKELTFSEMVVLKSIIGRYVDHMVENPGSFVRNIFCVVRICHVSKAGLFRIRNQADYTYIAMMNTVFPQGSHENIHTFLLSPPLKTVSPARTEAFGALTNDAFTLDHELAMNPKERKVVLEALERDVNFLHSVNLENYCVLYAITIREKAFLLQLPGAPYGPETDTHIEVDRRDTIPHRHDLAYGAHSSAAQLIPVPYKNYEFMAREYFFGIVDILVVDDHRDHLRR
jgi:hypothetical protein